MVRASRNRGFTLVEFLVVIAIMGALIGMLLPAIGQCPRIGAEVAVLAELNMRQVGMALATHHETFKRYPPSCAYARTVGLTAVTRGRSWLTYLLPFMDRKGHV